MSSASASSASSSSSGERRQFIGRPSNNVGLGICGLPNVGKSTLFNALSKLNVPAENYPFCTIDPKDARVPVPDVRFDFLVQTFKPKSVVPAVLTVTDIAGLVKGAHEGKGLGNAFLSHINAVDAIYHVVRGFSDDSIEHVEGSVDPTRDLEIISEELQLKDLDKVTQRWDAVKRIVERGADKTKKQDLETLTKAKELLEAKKDIRSYNWNGKDIEILNQELFLTSKPIVYLVNISEQEYITKKNKWLKKIYDWIKARDQFAELIPFSAAFETKLDKFSEEEKKKYCEDMKCSSALPKIILAGYHCLDLIHFFTAGEDEVRAWTLRRGTVAPGAAGVIHTDFQKNFVCAEVMAFEHFKEYGSEGAVKAAGKYKTQGKLYEVVDGDIIYFKHSASGGKKK